MGPGKWKAEFNGGLSQFPCKAAFPTGICLYSLLRINGEIVPVHKERRRKSLRNTKPPLHEEGVLESPSLSFSQNWRERASFIAVKFRLKISCSF